VYNVVVILLSMLVALRSSTATKSSVCRNDCSIAVMHSSATAISSVISNSSGTATVYSSDTSITTSSDTVSLSSSVDTDS
jgi:hypothetical protein